MSEISSCVCYISTILQQTLCVSQTTISVNYPKHVHPKLPHKPAANGLHVGNQPFSQRINHSRLIMADAPSCVGHIESELWQIINIGFQRSHSLGILLLSSMQCPDHYVNLVPAEVIKAHDRLLSPTLNLDAMSTRVVAILYRDRLNTISSICRSHVVAKTGYLP